MMRSAEIDAWVQRIAQATAAGRQNEDFRVELKAEWPKPDDAAWRLAGHANAASGEAILWVIGLAPDGTVTPSPINELADWWPGVCKHFDDNVVPTMRDVIVHLDAGPVVALLFETEAAPFVIRGGRHNFEVPWREGTRVDGARRRHLTRLLAPTAARPTFDTLYCELYESRSRPKDTPPRLEFDWVVFATPVSIQQPFFIAVHRSSVSFSYEDGTVILEPDRPQFDQWTPVTSGAAMINVPREINLSGMFDVTADLIRGDAPVRATLSLGIAGIEHAITLQHLLPPDTATFSWRLERRTK